jgi:cytochrome c5
VNPEGSDIIMITTKPIALAACAVVLLAACGQSSNQTVGAPPAAPAAVPAAPGKTDIVAEESGYAKGEETFKKVCALCHKTGEAGAPKVGDKADWGLRIAQGKDALYAHALNGFTGQKGMMPAKGGGATLSDEDVRAAVDYLVSKAH